MTGKAELTTQEILWSLERERGRDTKAQGERGAERGRESYLMGYRCSGTLVPIDRGFQLPDSGGRERERERECRGTGGAFNCFSQPQMYGSEKGVQQGRGGGGGGPLGRLGPRQ